jgi:hypothetical protein
MHPQKPVHEQGPSSNISLHSHANKLYNYEEKSNWTLLKKKSKHTNQLPLIYEIKFPKNIGKKHIV